MLDVRRLRLLVELNRRGTIAAVAEALHMSPSGISQQLSLLEKEVGAVLLERVGRGLRLTTPGRQLAARGSEVLGALEAAETELRRLSPEATGTVRVAAFQSAALVLVPELLDRARIHPALRIEMAQAEPELAIPAMLSGEYDVVISEEYPGTRPAALREAHREILHTDPLDFVLPVSWAQRGDLSRVGAEVPWILEPRATASREWAEYALRALGFEPDVPFESSDLLVHRELIVHGHAAGILPHLMLRGFDTGIARSPSGQSRTLVTLVRRGRELDPAIQLVRAELHRAVRGQDSATKLTGSVQE